LPFRDILGVFRRVESCSHILCYSGKYKTQQSSGLEKVEIS
jgi:hypothetical protein